MGRSVMTHPDSVAIAYRWIEYEDDDFFDFDEDIEYLREWIKERYPSFHNADEWPYREIHTILRSNFAEVHISEYYGCVALCLTVRQDLDDWEFPLAERWAGQIASNFEKRFGSMVKIGTFSNGEAVYQKR